MVQQNAKRSSPTREARAHPTICGRHGRRYIRTEMSCRGLGVARQLILFSLDSMGSGHCVQVERRFHNIYRESHLHLLK